MTDMIIRTAGYGEIVPEYDIIIFDEAHQLESVATQHLGLTGSHYRIEELIRDIQREMAVAGADGQKDLTQFLAVLLSLSQQFFANFYQAAESYRIKEEHLGRSCGIRFTLWKPGSAPCAVALTVCRKRPTSLNNVAAGQCS
jgi:Rad3-related DNA helicase